MIDPDQLIAVARQLNSDQAGAPPTAEAVRRAVSTAYYALFHAVLIEGAARLVGPSNSSAAFEVIYRGFNHAQISRVLRDVDRPTLTEPYRKLLRRSVVSQEIRDFAAVFVPMQDLRHLADYNPIVSIPQREAADLIDSAEAALRSLRSADPDEKIDLLAVMLIKAR